MSQSSQLAGYKPVILIITAAATACSVYAVYRKISSFPTAPALHRSNAVRGTRRERPDRITIEFVQPSHGNVLGALRINRGNGSVLYPLHTAGIPNDDDIIQTLGAVPTDPGFHRQLNLAAVQCILQACLVARSPAQRARLRDFRLAGLSEAIANQAVDEIHLQAYYIRSSFRTITYPEISEAVEKFLESNAFLGQDSNDGAIAPTETENADERDSSSPEPSQGLKGLLYHIAETDAKRKAYEHRGITCEECGEYPIKGIRWHCLNCPDFDLCSTCEANTGHQTTHVFVKIRIPLPVLSQPPMEHPLWYPGDPRKLHSPLNQGVKKRLQKDYGFDEPKVDAKYDQFTTIANVPWPNDPDGVEGAIDRRAFNKALTSERWPRRFRPNALYDRMFAFYDTNSDGLIGFEEFVSGMAYLRGPKAYASLKRALKGFDIDGDEYVDRNDFLRMLRAKYEIQKLLVNAMIEGYEAQQTQGAMETLRGSQPISSVFTYEDIPPGENRRPAGKELDRFNDMQPLPGEETILSDNDGWDEKSDTQQRHGHLQNAATSSRDRQCWSSHFEEELRNPMSGGNGSANGFRLQEDDTVAPGRTAPSGTNLRRLQSSRSSNDSRSQSADSETERPFHDDVLWQVVEDGFKEMLDPIFAEREGLDMNVFASKADRDSWREEIEGLVKQEEEFGEQLATAAEVDPLMATAKQSLDEASARKEKRGRNGQPARNFIGEIVPTDAASLTRREEEISQQPLERLLSTSGYSTVDADARGQSANSVMNGSAMGASRRATEATIRSRVFGNQTGDTHGPQSFVIATADLERDPTMPQNRPNGNDEVTPLTLPLTAGSAMSVILEKNPGSSPSYVPLGKNEYPSAEKLKELASLDKQDQETKARGGPGRLSFEEIIEIVEDNKELRGLVTNWLEWASF